MNMNRFDYTNYDDGTESIYDAKKDEYYFDSQLSKIEELLNEMEDENENLKEKLDELLDFFDLQLSKIEELLNEMEDENENLKEKLDELLDLVSTQISKNIDLFHTLNQLQIDNMRLEGMLKLKGELKE